MNGYTDQYGIFRPVRWISIYREEIERAKITLKAKGWSNRAAAQELGCCWTHLSKVLNGHRQSNRLIRAILDLPKNDKKTS
jgi:hypothetical protein